MSASVFPARAGMSPVTGAVADFSCCVPRASGDEPPANYVEILRAECSPRERG